MIIQAQALKSLDLDLRRQNSTRFDKILRTRERTDTTLYTDRIERIVYGTMHCTAIQCLLNLITAHHGWANDKKFSNA